MTKFLLFFLELFRLLFILFITGSIFSYLNLKIIHVIIDQPITSEQMIEINPINGILFVVQMIGFFILFLLLYRNKLQFSGWYKKGEQVKPIPKKWTRTLLLLALLFIFVPYFLFTV